MKTAENQMKIILDFIIEYIQIHGYSPSVREICVGTYFQSTSTIHSYLKRMNDLGMIETDAKLGTARAIRVPGYKFVKVD